jgi:hypothetical protein
MNEAGDAVEEDVAAVKSEDDSEKLEDGVNLRRILSA